MINLYLMLAILIANIIAIWAVYHFIKKLPKKEVLIFIAMSVALMYILISIVYWLSGFKVDATVHETAKNFITFLFVPINVIIFMPYIASKYYKVRQNKMKMEELIRKVSKMVILLIIVLVIEYFYFGNIQNNIAKINKDIEENLQIQAENIIKNETVNNEIMNNEEQIQNNSENEIMTNEVKMENIITNQL